MTKFELSDYYAPAREGSHETSHRETAENYANVVYQRGRYRVIVSVDDVQWIFQIRTGKNAATARWRSERYFLTQKHLITYSRAYFGAPTPMELIDLPEFFKRGKK